MNFEFHADSGEQVIYSSVYESGGTRGLQIVAVAGSLGDDDNRAEIAVMAVSEFNAENSQEVYRFTGIAPNDTYALLLYPGTESGIQGSSATLNGVLPAKFQLRANNVMGLPMNISVAASML